MVSHRTGATTLDASTVALRSDLLAPFTLACWVHAQGVLRRVGPRLPLVLDALALMRCQFTAAGVGAPGAGGVWHGGFFQVEGVVYAPAMNKSGYQRALLIGGIIFVVVGGIIWVSAANALQPATWYGNQQGIAQANAWMWAGIVAVILGVLIVVAYLVVRAAAGDEEPEPVERLDLSQLRAQRAAEQHVAPTPGIAELQAIADLHERGVLSDAEFEAAKQRLLGTGSQQALQKPR